MFSSCVEVAKYVHERGVITCCTGVILLHLTLGWREAEKEILPTHHHRFYTRKSNCRSMCHTDKLKAAAICRHIPEVFPRACAILLPKSLETHIVTTRKMKLTWTRALRKASMTINATRSNAEILRHISSSPSSLAKLENEESPLDADVADKKVENSTAQASKDNESKKRKSAGWALGCIGNFSLFVIIAVKKALLIVLIFSRMLSRCHVLRVAWASPKRPTHHRRYRRSWVKLLWVLDFLRFPWIWGDDEEKIPRNCQYWFRFKQNGKFVWNLLHP